MPGLYAHVPHPHRAHRAEHGPVQVADVRAGGNLLTRVNTRAAVLVTRAVGTMYAAYLFALLAFYGLPAAVKNGPSGLVLWVSSEFLQLVLLPVIIVGAAVLAEVTDRLARRQFDDVEVILHAQDQTAAHLAAQDEKILDILARLDARTAGFEDVLDAIAALPRFAPGGFIPRPPGPPDSTLAFGGGGGGGEYAPGGGGGSGYHPPAGGGGGHPPPSGSGAGP